MKLIASIFLSLVLILALTIKHIKRNKIKHKISVKIKLFLKYFIVILYFLKMLKYFNMDKLLKIIVMKTINAIYLKKIQK